MRQPRQKHEPGFTLIELLIVIAIIAILALIAIPNFLESQVRAKVSRVEADMRSVATALEAYVVDNNVYPLCGWDCNQLQAINYLPPDPFPCNNLWALSKLTTPISYLTGLPKDPFLEKGIIGQTDQTPQERGPRNTFEYKAIFANGPNYGILDRAFGKNHAQVISWNRGYRWTLDSLGPSRTVARPEQPTDALDPFTILSSKEPLDIYDPTNGTMSVGLILRTNKGMYAAQDY